jgi:hypothetical protein
LWKGKRDHFPMSLSPDMKAGRLTYDPEYAMHMSALGGKADIAPAPQNVRL